MGGVQNLLPAVIAARMRGEFGGTIENAHICVGSGDGQRAAHRLWRNRVAVAVEGDVDGLVRASGFDPVGGKGMRRRG